LPSNTVLQLTASREIVRFLKASCGALAAAEHQPVGRLAPFIAEIQVCYNPAETDCKAACRILGGVL
jgi:hypothetical protein